MKSRVFYPKLSTILEGLRIGVILSLAVMGVVLVLGGILFVLYLGALNYWRIETTNRMAQLNQDVLALSEELGYTPERLLLQEKGDIGTSLIFIDTSTECYTHLYFTTPLTVDQVTQRVNALKPPLKDTRRKDEGPEFDWLSVPVTVQPTDSEQAQALWENTTKTTYIWWNGDASDIDVRYYDVKSLPVTLAHKGRPLQDNIVQVDGQAYVSFWGACPRETVEP